MKQKLVKSKLVKSEAGINNFEKCLARLSKKKENTDY